MRIFIFLFLISTYSVFAQTEKLDKFPADIQEANNFTARQVSEMAIFPGCEHLSNKDKTALQKCFQQNITNLLIDKLADFSDKMDELKISTATTKLQFVVSNNGKLTEIQSMGGTPELAVASENALKQIADEIPPIRPALLEDGSPVNLIFQLPVKFVMQQDSMEEPQFEWNELVMSTLIDDNTKYEIRMSKEQNFKIYEINKSGEIFLGTYTFIHEIGQTEPYKTLIGKNQGRNLITDGTMNGNRYKVYSESSDIEHIYIYQVENAQENLVEKLTYKDFYFLPKYAELIKR